MTPSPAVLSFFAALEHPWKALLEALHADLLASAPGLTDQIKWKAPSLCDGGDDRVTWRFPPKGGAQLIFHRGVKPKDVSGFRFEDPDKLLAWAAPDRGVLTFAGPDDVVAKGPAVVALVARWVAATR